MTPRNARTTPISGRDPGAGGLERPIARLLTMGTWVGMALLTVGVVLLLAAGRSPLDGGPRLDVGRIVGDVAALRAEGFLWLGLLVIIATPAARVAASLVGYVTGRERLMALVAAAILGVIALGVALGLAAEA